jgi:hypothetical protein
MLTVFFVGAEYDLTISVNACSQAVLTCKFYSFCLLRCSLLYIRRQNATAGNQLDFKVILNMPYALFSFNAVLTVFFTGFLVFTSGCFCVRKR